ncbi:hypothetical protein [Actinomadura rubrisoli]|uniref:Uncharacterized protein n=1 Tax=Actinomadura rubrisoli TaxID=2530368 RepID=A0A4R5BJK3_9ACTN|nr:hypothetical protein [Actinomadura rubrisoli]TDD83952.1 hypothetical protein E1298_20635 [Actinomadura rubrisoli]
MRIADGRDPRPSAMLDAQSIKPSEGGEQRGFDMGRLAAAFGSVALVRADGGYANKIDNSLLSWA